MAEGIFCLDNVSGYNTYKQIKVSTILTSLFSLSDNHNFTTDHLDRVRKNSTHKIKINKVSITVNNDSSRNIGKIKKKNSDKSSI